MGHEQEATAAMVGDLVVIDFQSDNLSQSISEWKRSAPVPFGQNCRRNLYYGFADDFEEFPYDKLDRSYTDLGGADAYAHILKFASGYERGQYNSHNRSQFFEGWAQSTAKNPEISDKYSKLLSLITNDTKFMHKHITSHYKTRRLELSARDLSGIEKGDDALIVGSLSRDGSLSMMTTGLIRVLESKQKGRNNFISLTHPDPEVMDTMREAVETCEVRGNIRSGIQFVDFENIAMAVELSERVYIAMPMEANPVAEMEIIEAWKNRADHDNTLTHISGDPLDKGSMTSLWENADLDNFISPYDIREDMVDRATHNAEVIVKAEQAFWKCAELRIQGSPIRKEDFFSRAPDLSME